MGLFGFGRKKKEEEAPVLAEVGLRDLTKWFEETMEADLNSRLREAEQKYNEVVDGFSGILSSLDKLDSSRISGTERMYISANMIKESFVKKKYPQIREVLSLRDGFRRDYTYFNSFQNRASQVLGTLKESTPKQSILLTRYFKKESQALVESIRQADQASNDLGEFLKKGSGSLAALNRIRHSVGQAEGIIAEQSELDSQMAELENHAKKARERKAELEKQFIALIKGKEWNKLNTLIGEEASLKESLRNADSRLNTELSSLRRPLKQADHILANRGNLSPIHKNSIRDFIKNPFKSVIGDKDNALLRSVQAVKKQLDKLGVRDADMSGVVEGFEKKVPELRSLYLSEKNRLEKEKEKLRSLSKLKVSKQAIETEIKRMSDGIGSVEESIREKKQEKSSKANELSARLKDLEEMAREEAKRLVKIYT